MPQSFSSSSGMAIGELYSGPFINFIKLGSTTTAFQTKSRRTKHEKLHYKKVINHATYINYHCSMGPWTFIKLFGVFGALAAPSALTLPWPYWGADCYIATRLLISFQFNAINLLKVVSGVEIFWLKEP